MASRPPVEVRATEQPPARAGGGEVPRAGSAFAREAVAALVEALEADPDLTARLRALVIPAQDVSSGIATPLPANMSIREYAAHTTVSERTIRSDLKLMTPGVHFRRDGAKGRRVIIHVLEADTWRKTRERVRDARCDVEELANNVVLQRFAKAALKRVRNR